MVDLDIHLCSHFSFCCFNKFPSLH